MHSSFVAGFILLLTFPCGSDNATYPLSLEGTATKAARPYFEQGLLLLHNFEYVDAAEQFALAQQHDPAFILSYWGEAMTYDHPIWRNGDIERSRAVLTKAARNAVARTPLERGLMAGVQTLFGEGSKAERERAYAKHMAGMYERYPDNQDIAAFYALSVLATKDDWTQWEDNNVQAAEIAQHILEENPDHPGALHYLIHADDHPLYANRGLGAADRYAKVASYAGHALHMPSHIYLALGMWDQVVRSNEVAWQAGVDRKERRGLNNDALNYHAHWWLAYGYLQQGRFEKARELIDDQLRYVSELPSSIAYFHLLQMKGHYLFTTNDWNGPVANIPIDASKLDRRDRYIHYFLEGYRAFKANKREQLATLIAELETDLAKSRQLTQEASEGTSICGAGGYTSTDLKAGERYLRELKGLHAWQQSDPATTEAHFKESLPAEGSIVIGPPTFLISPHELYGQFLLENKRPAEALQQFEKALAASPNRYIGLAGKLAVAMALNDAALEHSVREQLQRNLEKSQRSAVDGPR